MIALFPLSAMAADSGAAVVHSKGGVWVNGAEAMDSTSVFPGDVLETRPGFVANLDAEGTSVLIQAESIVKFQGNSLLLEHGSVRVGTSTSFVVHVQCLRVEPITNDRTQYDVTDTSGTVDVAALKSDVKVSESGNLQKVSKQDAPAQSAVVHEGQEAKRHELPCAAAPGTTPASSSSINMKWLEIGGGAAAGVGALCLLFCKGSPASKVSNDAP